MLAIVSIVYVQNERVKESSYEFPRAEIYTLGRLNVAGVSEKLDTLKAELEALPNVDSVSFSSQVPFEQNNSTANFTLSPGDEASEFRLNQISISPDFLETYDIPVLEGRTLREDISNDRRDENDPALNVLINELAVSRLEVASAQDALGKRFYMLDRDGVTREYVVVGVVPSQNILGLFNEVRPWVYNYDPPYLRMGSVRITGGNILETVESIEDVWQSIIPDYPMQGAFLDDYFNDIYRILSTMNAALAGFAFLAMALAMIGLFGLAAFMATLRTKEIGVRKVLGASSAQIARLLVWQFSRPVLWALLAALPAAYLASSVYLNFFADRIDTQLPILVGAGLIAVVLAWVTIAGHAIRIARANPVMALRYE
jgi:putative ABC transport system permease protein